MKYIQGIQICINISQKKDWPKRIGILTANAFFHNVLALTILSEKVLLATLQVTHINGIKMYKA